MALTVKNNTKIAIEEEVTEGTYVTPAGASSFLQTLADGTELKIEKELLERNIFNGSLGKTSPRTGQRTSSGTIPVEARANSVAGSAPEYDKLIKCAMGTKRQNTTVITTKSSGNTATVLCVDDADNAKVLAGDIILVKQSGAYHVSPVASTTTGAGTSTITMLIPHPSGDCTDSVTIEKFTTYTVADSGHTSLSITKYVEDAIREYAVGSRVTSMALENFSTGQIPTLKFGFEGLDGIKSVTAPSFSPSYDTALPPIVLDGRAYMDTTALEINDLTFSLENKLGFETSIASSNGRISGRPVERVITGTFNPYKKNDTVANYTKFSANTSFSLFAYAMVPTGVSGQFGQIIAVYMPNCIITELGESDKDGLLQDTIAFSANRGAAGTSKEIYFSTI